jgi:hypothetical protein
MNLKKKWDQVESTLPVTDTSTDTPCPEAERLVTTANVTPKTTISNSLLPNTASNDIQQHVNSANSGDGNRAVFIVLTMCKHWNLGCINKNSLTSGKP